MKNGFQERHLKVAHSVSNPPVILSSVSKLVSRSLNQTALEYPSAYVGFLFVIFELTLERNLFYAPISHDLIITGDPWRGFYPRQEVKKKSWDYYKALLLKGHQIFYIGVANQGCYGLNVPQILEGLNLGSHLSKKPISSLKDPRTLFDRTVVDYWSKAPAVVREAIFPTLGYLSAMPLLREGLITPPSNSYDSHRCIYAALQLLGRAE